MVVTCQQPPKQQRIRQHYDLLSPFYRFLWGPHIHHGYFETDEAAHRAQEKLIEKLLEFAGIASAGRTLDIGCVLGGTSIFFWQRISQRQQLE